VPPEILHRQFRCTKIFSPVQRIPRRMKYDGCSPFFRLGVGFPVPTCSVVLFSPCLHFETRGPSLFVTRSLLFARMWSIFDHFRGLSGSMCPPFGHWGVVDMASFNLVSGAPVRSIDFKLFSMPFFFPSFYFFVPLVFLALLT